MNNLMYFLLTYLDTIEDFYNSPYPVGSYFKYGEWDLLTHGSGYESYAPDIEGAYAKLGNGTYSLLESRDSLRYLMRSRFTNE